MKRSAAIAKPSAFEITLPATTANLGPAVDAAALALGLHMNVRARKSEEFSVRARGRDAEICGNPKNNLLLDTYRQLLRANGRRVQPLALEVQNQIPIGKGCGSSAAARLAGVALAVHFGKLRWSDDDILAEAASREGHPDNVAACWLGGLALAHTATGNGAEQSRLVAVSLRTPARWRLLLAVPAEALPTEQARAVLPRQYSQADAVANVQSAMLLAAAFAEARGDLLRRALRDRLHEPYRQELCPLLAPLRSLTGHDGILGVALSGAGPSVLLVLDRRASLARVRRRVAEALHGDGCAPELLVTSIETRGGRARRSPAQPASRNGGRG